MLGLRDPGRRSTMIVQHICRPMQINQVMDFSRAAASHRAPNVSAVIRIGHQPATLPGFGQRDRHSNCGVSGIQLFLVSRQKQALTRTARSCSMLSIGSRASAGHSWRNSQRTHRIFSRGFRGCLPYNHRLASPLQEFDAARPTAGFRTECGQSKLRRDDRRDGR